MTNIERPAGRRVLIACEKPSMAQLEYETWKRLYPDDEITFFYIPPMGRWSINVPRDLPLSMVPRISEPRYKENHYGYALRIFAAEGARFTNDLKGEAQRSDLIVCGTDCDHAGVFNFWNTIRLCGLEVSEDILWWRILSTTPKDMEEAILSGRTVMDPDFTAWRRIGEARRFFDYNYAINALPCFSHIFREVGAPLKLNFISKFGLQLLLKMVKDNLSLTEREILELMVHWPGSGKYGEQGLGSSISRGQIYEDLRSGGLLEQDYGRRYKNSRGRLIIPLKPSRLAFSVVERLHKGMEDPDLPARLDGWAGSWPESRPQMERYIRTVFGRQKRFM